ncbi:MAG: SEC-C metal-binding domain-containing protein [Gaiellaceae bacterium]
MRPSSGESCAAGLSSPAPRSSVGHDVRARGHCRLPAPQRQADGRCPPPVVRSGRGEIGRNEPCPCGSGVKVKRCCGTPEAQERIERAAGALEEAVTLAAHFPRLRAGGEAFSAWAEGAAALEPIDELLEGSLGLLEPAERARIVRDYAAASADAWRSLCEDAGGEELAANVLVAGAVAAAVAERRPPDEETLELIETVDLEDDPCEALALGLEAGDLWSIVESYEADEAVGRLENELDDAAYELLWNATLESEAARLGGEWHRERLAALVERLRSRLPFEDFPAASTALAAACEAFARDEDVRRRLAASLLADSLGRIRLAEIGLIGH